MKRLGLLLAFCVLASCGGGGSETGMSAPIQSTSTPPTSKVTSFSGVVATGAMVEGAEISIDDLDGRVADTISDAAGGWIVPLADIKRALKPPFRFHAKFTRAGRTFDLFSISLESSGNIQANITPISDMVTRSYAWDVSTTDDTAWMKTTPNQGRLDTSIAGVKKFYGDALAGTENLISGNYDRNPNVNKQDGALEITGVPIYDNGNVTIIDGAGHQLAKTTLGKISTNKLAATDAETISKAELDAAKIIRGALPDSPPVLRNNAIPVIASVFPLVATVNVPATFVVTGINLGRINYLSLTIEGCPNIQNLGGTDTSQNFGCTPSAAGVKNGTVKEAVSGTNRSTFSVVVSAPALPVEASVIDSVSPLIAALNQTTIFTLTGKNLINGMRFTLEGCSGTEILGSGSSTMRQFACTPALSGPNKGEIKDTVDGLLLKTFLVAVNKQVSILTGAWEQLQVTGAVFMRVSYSQVGSSTQEIKTIYNAGGDYSPTIQAISNITNSSSVTLPDGSVSYTYNVTVISAVECSFETNMGRYWAGKFVPLPNAGSTGQADDTRISADGRLMTLGNGYTLRPSSPAPVISAGTACVIY